MAQFLKRWWAAALAVIVMAGGLTYAFWPRPVMVSLGTAEHGAMLVTVEDEGETRVKEVYTISAPLAGRVARFGGHVGDDVVAGETVVASIRPTEPTLRDARTQSELEAALKAAKAARDLAKAEVVKAKAARDFAESEFRRARELAARGTISTSALDRARMETRTQDAAVETARASLRVREFEVQTAAAALANPASNGKGPDSASCCFEVRAPVSGTILKVYQESEAVVSAGTPLVEIGDPADLEIVVDLLSTEAVGVSPGDEVLIEDWGEPRTLEGRVRRIEPLGFTKVSALGIEEQRVNVIVDFVDPPEKRKRLGHGYRVLAKIVQWRGDDVLTVPLSALFRVDDKWALFRVEDDRAHQVLVEVGHMNGRLAEIRSGIKTGDTIVLHPSDTVRDDTRVMARETR